MGIEKLLKDIRGRDSLREASEKTGLSHTYISILEKGVDPRTKSPLNPSPETLRAYSRGYNYPYEELMKIAGYMDGDNDSSTNDQAKNAVFETYSRLPQDKKKLIDDMIKALDNE